MKRRTPHLLANDNTCDVLKQKISKLLRKSGYDADLVLFDYDTICDHADFVDPFKPNEGIYQVYVGGSLSLENNTPTGNYNGKYLRKAGA